MGVAQQRQQGQPRGLLVAVVVVVVVVAAPTPTGAC
jgi:hypothetical protein